MPKLNWKNIKKKKCPNCGSGLEYYDNSFIYKCVDCDFTITEERYLSLIEDLDRDEAKHEMEGFGFED